jgi:hypothetical protein
MSDHNRPHSYSPADGSAPEPDRADLTLDFPDPFPAGFGERGHSRLSSSVKDLESRRSDHYHDLESRSGGGGPAR